MWTIGAQEAVNGQVPVAMLVNHVWKQSWVLPQSRVNHVLQYLDRQNVSDVLTNPCCKNGCNLKCTPQMIVESRIQGFQQPSKDLSLKFMANTIRSQNTDNTSPSKRGKGSPKFKLLDSMPILLTFLRTAR